MNDVDIKNLQKVIDIARQAREHGNHPFGAILVNEKNEVVLTAENTVNTDKDLTGHAETNLVRLASRKYSTDQMASFTMYASAEPCAMCAGAIHWSHVGRLVFALSEVDLYEIAGPSPEHLILSCREVFQHSSQAIDVSGPCQELDKEARAVLAGFWTK